MISSKLPIQLSISIEFVNSSFLRHKLEQPCRMVMCYIDCNRSVLLMHWLHIQMKKRLSHCKILWQWPCLNQKFQPNFACRLWSKHRGSSHPPKFPCNWLMQVIHRLLFSSLIFPWTNWNGWNSHNVRLFPCSHMIMRLYVESKSSLDGRNKNRNFFVVNLCALLPLFCSKSNAISTIVCTIFERYCYAFECARSTP